MEDDIFFDNQILQTNESNHITEPFINTPKPIRHLKKSSILKKKDIKSS
jgi:hypothetical protein